MINLVVQHRWDEIHKLVLNFNFRNVGNYKEKAVLHNVLYGH